MRLNQLSKLFDLNEMVYFEGKLYERLYYDVKSRSKDGPKHKYRVVINSDDYDYVAEPALRKRLDRVFNKTDLEGRQELGSLHLKWINEQRRKFGLDPIETGPR